MLENLLDRAVQLLWGRGTIAFTLLCGLYFTAFTHFLPLRKIGLVTQKTLGSLFCKKESKDSISPFAAVSTALGGTMGVGNIIGVGAALALGGAGSIFWMWVGALLGMMTKYMEVFLAVRWRVRRPGSRSFCGGPMYYCARGIPHPIGKLLAVLFCIFCILSSLSSGSMVQTNAIAQSMQQSFSVSPSLCAVVLVLVCGWVLHGGCDRAVQTCSASKDSISPFAAVSTALGGTMGVGNIIGVGAALALGGAGSIFWMWVGALLGMMTKYMEVFLAVRWRVRRPGSRSFCGGPMYYCARGIPHPIGKLLAVLFCIFCILSSLSSGSMVQTNAIAQSMQQSFSVSPSLCAVVLVLVCGWVLHGGCDRAVQTCSALVPWMSALYLFGCGIILFHFRQNIPSAFSQILTQAFSSGGIAGAAGSGVGFFTCVRVGISRGIFTHEAGLGSASIAHACSGADSPVEQGFWGIFEVFCDTILVCTITALSILASGVPLGASGAYQAFCSVMGKTGGRLLGISLSLFAFASVISFCLYGQRCVEYLFGDSRHALFLYRCIFLVGCAAGCFARLPVVFALADLLNACLLLPNLIVLLILSSQVFSATREYCLKGATHLCSSVHSNLVPSSKSCCAQRQSSQRSC